MSLARLRKSKGFSQRSLGKAADISPSTVYDIEAGRHEPNPTTLRKIAAALGVTPEEVWETVESPKADAPTASPALGEEERRALACVRPWFTLFGRLAEDMEELATQGGFNPGGMRQAIKEHGRAYDGLTTALLELQKEGIDPHSGHLKEEMDKAVDGLDSAFSKLIRRAAEADMEDALLRQARKQRRTAREVGSLEEPLEEQA